MAIVYAKETRSQTGYRGQHVEDMMSQLVSGKVPWGGPLVMCCVCPDPGEDRSAGQLDCLAPELPSFGLCLIKMSNGSISPLRLQLEAFLAAPSLLSPSPPASPQGGSPSTTQCLCLCSPCALPPQLDNLICEKTHALGTSGRFLLPLKRNCL